MSFIWITISIVLFIVWVITVVDIFRRPLSTKMKVAWLLIVVIIPYIGAIAYWIMRKPEAGDLERTYEAQHDLQQEAQRTPFDSQTGFRG
jgi:hypothetical protein